jgi:hypothetical protein
VSDTVASCDGRFRLDMQPDGNLVLCQTNGPLWGSGTAGKGGAVARMQTDGDVAAEEGVQGGLIAG